MLIATGLGKHIENVLILCLDDANAGLKLMFKNILDFALAPNGNGG